MTELIAWVAPLLVLVAYIALAVSALAYIWREWPGGVSASRCPVRTERPADANRRSAGDRHRTTVAR